MPRPLGSPTGAAGLHQYFFCFPYFVFLCSDLFDFDHVAFADFFVGLLFRYSYRQLPFEHWFLLEFVVFQVHLVRIVHFFQEKPLLGRTLEQIKVINENISGNILRKTQMIFLVAEL